ncbi:MAG: RluA family pseudouridine synthase [Burkholderiales bacterium]
MPNQIRVLPAFPLIHADPAFLIVDKPAGLLAVPGRGADKQDCLSARVQREFADALVVHRLDMATSGLMVFARGADAQRALSRSFAERQVDKRYEAVVNGCVEPPESEWGTIDLPIGIDWPRRPLRVIDPERGKPSVTRWRVLGVDESANQSRLELKPVTGRSHQLRVHLKAIGHGIVGDALYRDAETEGLATRLMLHASQLGFSHPVSGAPCHWRSAVPF